jgi:Clr5 domain
MAPSAVEWEQQRQLITRLYFEGNKPLKEVREMLANEHNFQAT